MFTQFTPKTPDSPRIPNPAFLAARLFPLGDFMVWLKYASDAVPAAANVGLDPAEIEGESPLMDEFMEAHPGGYTAARADLLASPEAFTAAYYRWRDERYQRVYVPGLRESQCWFYPRGCDYIVEFAEGRDCRGDGEWMAIRAEIEDAYCARIGNVRES